MACWNLASECEISDNNGKKLDEIEHVQLFCN